MTDYKLKEFHCPACGVELDGAFDAHKDPRPPQAGDASVCIACAALLIFSDSEGHVRLAREDEIDDEMRKFQRLVRMHIRHIERRQLGGKP